MNALEVIARKRDGKEHTAAELQFLLSGYLDGEIADYQMAAWLMAVCTRGMTHAETLELTKAMVASGETVDLSSIPGVKVDKHSTGGVGDKVTLIAIPLAAAYGVKVAKLSGRGLAHTGGTLDKLESVPGLTVDLEPERFLRQVRDVGLAVAAQSPRIVPADRALYALRDVTATVPSTALIASSIMSKKLAAGADAIVLDVKYGRGAFVPDIDSATQLASEMVQIGEGAGRRVVALVTAMEFPLGKAVGNALEVQEALDALDGRGDPELIGVSEAVAGEMCRLAGIAADPKVAGGRGREWFERMIAAQGGRLAEGLPVAPVQLVVPALIEGWVNAIDALEVGRVSLTLGAGRMTKGERIDHAVGVVIEAQVGKKVQRNDTLAVIHARTDEVAAQVRDRLEAAWTIAEHSVPAMPHIHARIDRAGVSRIHA